jgi:hypothetical protein
MTWTKLSDDFTDDCWTLSDPAYRLHTDGLVWSNRKLLDLRIPKDEVRRFAKNADALPELIEGGWWTDHGSYFRIEHHARYQREREAVIRQQHVNKENRAKRGQAQPPAREVSFKPSNDSSHDSLNDSTYEMDGSGLASTKEISSNEKTSDEVNEATGEVTTGWPTVTIPGAGEQSGDVEASKNNSPRLHAVFASKAVS